MLSTALMPVAATAQGINAKGPLPAANTAMGNDAEMPVDSPGTSGGASLPVQQDAIDHFPGGAAPGVNPLISGGGPTVLDIKKLQKTSETGEDLFSLELRSIELGDIFRVVAHDYNLNILVDKDVSGKVTASMTSIPLNEALDQIAEMHNLIIERKGNMMIVKPNLITKIFFLKHIEAKTILTARKSSSSADLTAGSEMQSVGSQAAMAAALGPEANQALTRAATIYDLLSPKGRVLLGMQPNSIMVIDNPDRVAKVGTYLEMVDRKMVSQLFNLKYISAKELLTGAVEPQDQDTSYSQGVDGPAGPPAPTRSTSSRSRY